MMRYTIWLFFIALYAVPATAQENPMRIRTEHGLYPLVDTGMIQTLIRRGHALRYSAPDSGKQLYEDALYRSRQGGYIDGIAAALLGLSGFYADKGELSKSAALLRSALPYGEASSDPDRYIVALNNALGVVYTHFGMFDTAALYYYRALKKFEQRQMTDTPLLLELHTNLGGTWVTNMQYDQGLFYLEKAAVIAQRRGAKRRLGPIYLNMSVAYGGRDDLKQAFAFTDKALAIAKEFNDRMLEAFANYTKGTLYVNHDNSAQAIVYFRRALETDTSDTHNVQMCCRGLAAAYHKTRQFGEAEKYYLKAIALAQKSNRTRALTELYNELTTLYTKTGNYKQALAYKQAYSHLIDSTLNAEKIYIASQLEVKYRTSEKDKELALKQLLLNKQQAALKQKNIWIGSILGGTVLVSALLFSIYTSNKRKQKLQQGYITALQQEREIMQLKAMMKGEEKERVRIARELHDGIMVQFSSVKMNLSAMLNRSVDRTDTEAFSRIVAQLDDATKELRKSAHNLMPDMLLEEGLSEAVHYFCRNLQQSTGIEIEFQQYGTLPQVAKEYELMLYRIIQELLQNAVKHSRASHILVQLNCSDNLLSIMIEDNGTGFDTQLLKLHKGGMGIRSLQARVSSLAGHIDISSERDVGTTVYIEFDIHALQQKYAYADNSSYNG